jgi:hypothetical protein
MSDSSRIPLCLVHAFGIEMCWCPIDKNEGIVKREVFLGGAGALPGSMSELGCEDQDSGTRLAVQFRWNHPFHQPSIRPPTSAMMLYANIQPSSPVRKWKTVFWFSKRASASFAPVRWMRERPIRFAA